MELRMLPDMQRRQLTEEILEVASDCVLTGE